MLQKIGLNLNSLVRNGDSSELLVNAKVRIFEERYSGGILDMNIFCFLLVSDNEYANRASSIGNTLSSKHHQPESKNIFKNGTFMIDAYKQQNGSSNLKQAFTKSIQELNEAAATKEESHSATGSSSSSHGSSASSAEFRNFHSFAT